MSGFLSQLIPSHPFMSSNSSLELSTDRLKEIIEQIQEQLNKNEHRNIIKLLKLVKIS